MTPKETALKAIQDLPDSATWADIEERVRFLAGMDKGIADIEAERVVPHGQVRGSLGEQLSCGMRDLRKLVSRIPEGYQARELDWGCLRGKEIR